MTKEYPPSRAQAEIWAANVYTPGLKLHLHRIYRLVGELDETALTQALDGAARRHESLRTVFREHMGRPRAVVLPPDSVHLGIIDLRGQAGNRDAEALRLAKQFALRPFEFWKEPAWRAALFRVDSDVNVFVLAVHEIVCDGWSWGILNREISELYAASRDDGAPSLPDLDTQYMDFALREHQWLKTEQAQLQMEYWKRELSGAPLAYELSRQNSAYRASVKVDHKAIGIPERVWRDLTAMASAERATSFMVCLAVYFVLLHLYSADEDLVVVSPTANRMDAGAQHVVGDFARMLPFRVRVSQGMRFREVLARVSRTVLDAMTHARAAPSHGHRLLQADGPRGLWSGQVDFRLAPARAGVLEAPLYLADLDSQLIGLTELSGYLSLAVEEDGHQATATLAYDAQTFDASVIMGMLRSYVRLLEICVEHPGAHVAHLGGLTGNAQAPNGDTPSFRGFRLNPRLRALERCLLGHPAIHDAVAMWDSTAGTVVAYVVPEGGARAYQDDLNRWVRNHMAKRLIPGRYVAVDTLPRRADRSVDIPAACGLAGQILIDRPHPARVAVEAKLSSIWQSLLERSDVGNRDNFFTLGGDLVLGVEMVMHARAAGIPLLPQQLLLAPTISELAEMATEALGDHSAEASAQSPGSAQTLKLGWDSSGKVVVRR